MNRWRKNHPAIWKACKERSRLRLQLRNAQIVTAYLQAHPCVDCGEADPVVLDFDHVRGEKRKEISDIVAQGLSVAYLEAEIAKCVVRCANDHRRKTVRERGGSVRERLVGSEGLRELVQ